MNIQHFSKNNHRLKLVGILALWFILYGLISPDFAGIDNYVFKNAGSNWALGRGFVTYFGLGNNDPRPYLYASYPPGFSFFFGVYSKIFGIGPYQNTFFNLTIALSCVFLWYELFYLLFQPLFRPKKYVVFILVTFLLAPSAFLGADKDRPESLSFLLLLASVLLSIPKMTMKRWSVVFLLLALNTFVSPFGSIIHFCCLALIHRKILFQIEYYKWSIAALVISVLPLVFIVFLFLSVDPTVIERFLNSSTKYGAGLGWVIDAVRKIGIGSYLKQTFLTVIKKDSLLHIGMVWSFILVYFFFPLFFLFRFLRTKDSKYLAWSFVVFMIHSIPFFLMNQMNYLAYARNASVVLVLFLHITEVKIQKMSYCVLSVVVGIVFVTHTPFFLRELYIRATNKDSYTRSFQQVRYLKSLVQNIKPEPIVIVAPCLFFLYKAHFNTFDLYWTPKIVSQLPRYYVLSYPGTGDLYTTDIPPNILLPEVEVISVPQLPQPTTFFGYKISKSSNIWESKILKNLQ